MNKHKWFAVYVSAFMLLQWAAWSFIALNPNPLAWPIDLRFAVVMMTPLLIGFAGLMARASE
jgi:hypothetical protein